MDLGDLKRNIGYDWIILLDGGYHQTVRVHCPLHNAIDGSAPVIDGSPILIIF